MEEIESRAAQVLEAVPDWIWDGDALPVPVEEIIDSHFGLRVRDETDLSAAPGCPPLGAGQSLSGLLLPDRAEIWVNAIEAREWPPRRRFTIAHELGHWVMHQDGQRSLFCRHGQIDPELVRPDDAKRPPLEPIEAEANRFAAALLMPAELVRLHYRATAGDFDRLCEIFGSSGAAMGRRLHDVV